MAKARRCPSSDPGKHDAGNRRHCRGLRRTAHRAASDPAALLRRRVPNLFAIRYAESGQPSALGWIGRQSYLDDRTRRGLSHQIGNRRVHLLPIAGHAPLHAAVGAALADARLPQNLAFAIRIQRINYARLLSGQQHVTAIGQVSQAAPTSRNRNPARGTCRPVQAPLNTSPGVTCLDHTIRPVLRSSASTASLISVAGVEKLSPVVMYSKPRLASSVGDPHTPAPEGPQVPTVPGPFSVPWASHESCRSSTPGFHPSRATPSRCRGTCNTDSRDCLSAFLPRRRRE